MGQGRPEDEGNVDPDSATPGELASLANDLLTNAFSQGTLATYSRRWQHFSQFAVRSLNECPLPAGENTILKYVAHLHKAGSAPSSIRSAVSVLAWKHKISALSDPTKGYRLMKVLKSLHKIYPM